MVRLNRWTLLLLTAALIVPALAGCRGESAPAAFTDDAGRAIKLAKAPERIVSHVPSITETLFALGLGERVVGVSDYCDYPAEAKLKEKVGDYFNPSVERIIALNPDLVLTDGHSQSLAGLEAVNIPYVIIDPKDVAGIFRNIALLGEVTGQRPAAEKLLGELTARRDAVTARVKNAPRVRVFYVFDITDPNNPWTAGPGAFVDTLITLSGGENVATATGAAWAQFSLEQVLAADPDILLADARMGTATISVNELHNHPVWGQLRAVREGRVYPVDSDLVNRSGPRIIQGLESVARTIHPELFR